MVRLTWCIVLSLGMTGLRAEATLPSVNEALAKMDAAKQRIDTFSCNFTLTKQLRIKSNRDAEGKIHSVPIDDPAQWSAEPIQKFNVVVSGKSFRKAILNESSAHSFEETWDGSQLIRLYPAEQPIRAFTGDRLGANDLMLADPREFAYDIDPTASIPDKLRAFPQQELISIRETTFNNRPVLFLEAVSTEPKTHGFRLWIDPALGFLPVQIERTLGPYIEYRFTEIKHKELQPGLWFPIAGTYQDFMFYEEAYRDRIAATTRLEVNLATINLNPPIGPDTFSMTLPAGTQVTDMTAPRRLLEARKSRLANKRSGWETRHTPTTQPMGK